MAYHVTIAPRNQPGVIKYLSNTVSSAAEPQYTDSPAEAISFQHPEPARRQTAALSDMLGSDWLVSMTDE